LRLLEQGQTHVILRSVTEADRERILRDPATAISCDCGAISSTTGHPRNWGAYPRFFAHYVKDRGVASWPEAVRRATALPAAMIGLVDRGWLREGMIADITLLDPSSIRDRATIQQPTLVSDGIRAVLVNGRFAWRDGVLVPGAGKTLRRAFREPTRVMCPDSRNSLQASLVMPGGTRVRAASARDGFRENEGRVVVSGLGSKGAFTMASVSLMQTAPGWAALTGVGHWDSGQEAAATLVIDMSNPVTAGRIAARLTVGGETVLDEVAVSGGASIKPSS
jgi:N-acyl-D-amino-acid deacylase